MTDTPIRAGIYCRLSRAIDGSTEKVEDQERISRGLAGQRGWDVAGVYSDNSLSAWKKNRKRPAWDRMLADVDAGKLDALVVYHGDRLIRHPKDLETLLELADTRGIRLAGPTGTRNLDNDDDRTMMRVEAAFAWRESANTSRRKRAGYERMRRKGLTRPGGKGGRAFCFAKDGVTQIPREAAIIRRAARAILRGHSVGSVAAGLRAQGVCSTAGIPMTHNTLRRILVSPRTAGLMPDGEHKAAWEPVLDRPVWEMIRAVLLVNEANPRAGRGALHLVSGIAVCGECGHALWAGLSAAALSYRCPDCCKVSRNAALLDAYVTGFVVARLSSPANPAPEVQLHDGASAELAALTARRAETEAFIANLADAPAGRIEILSRALDSFDAKISTIRDQMAGDSAGRLRAQYEGITRDEFEALPLDVRRALVRACCTVTVLRSSRRGGPGFREQDVSLVPV